MTLVIRFVLLCGVLACVQAEDAQVIVHAE